MKIAYLGIDFLHPALLSALQEGCEVLRIFTCRTDNVTEFNTAVLQTAQDYNIPCTLDRLTEKDLDRLEQEGCELLLCAGYYYRIPVTASFPMVNFHPSPLPTGRGGWPMPIILLRGLPYGGVTAHKMASQFDTGDILLRESFPIREDETLRSYMQQVHARIPAMVHRLVHELPTLLEHAVPQGPGDYWPMPTEADWTVTPDMDVAQADRILRAFYGYECIYQTPEKRIELIGGRAVSGENQEQPFPVGGGYIQAERVRVL